jgi:hypothetical protein
MSIGASAFPRLAPAQQSLNALYVRLRHAEFVGGFVEAWERRFDYDLSAHRLLR